MKLNNLGEVSQSPSKTGIIVRIGLASFAILGSLILAWSFLNSHTHAHADASVSRTATTTTPWGLALDSQNVWVAEPGCDLDQKTAACPAGSQAGVIGQYSLSKGGKVQDFKPASGQNYIPVFVALDASGNVWFTDPTNNAIGEMTVSNGVGTWKEFTAPTANATPLDLVFDSNGNIWFTEYGTSHIGFYNVATNKFVETATPTTGSNPYGIRVAPNKDIWFTENAQKIVASFTPTTDGTLRIKEHAIGNTDPHLITTDKQGNIWYSEGSSGYIGEFTTADSKDHQFDVSQGVCPQTPTATNTPGSTPTATSTTGSTPTATNTPGSTPTTVATMGTAPKPVHQSRTTPKSAHSSDTTPTPTSQCSVHISGIGVDSSNKVWFDDSLSQRVGYLDPNNNNGVTASSIVTATDANPHPHDGLVIDGNNNVWVSEELGKNLDEFTAASLSVTPTPTTPPAGPVAKTWYFAEGRVGKGFRQYLTIDNPSSTTDCTVDIQYLYTPEKGHGAPGTKTFTRTVKAGTRLTEAVHKDFGMTENTLTFDTVSSIVTMNSASTCPGVMVERPEYFTNYNGISSGNDVPGMTHLSSSYYFADVPTGADNTSYLTILNPPTNDDATVTVDYYAGGQKVGAQSMLVPAGSRGTIAPSDVKPALPTHVAAVVTSTAQVAVERPTYFKAGDNGTSGGYDVVGAQAPANDWLFAEGYTSTTGNITQEYLTIANIDPKGTDASVTVTLRSKTGGVGTYKLTIKANDQLIWDVNAKNTFQGATPEVSAEVTSTGANIVVQREMYFRYSHIIKDGTSLQAKGGTDAMGMVGPIKQSSYSFAEGYTNTGYHTWLTLQNPNTTDETITITLVNGLSHSTVQTVKVFANSRQTVDVTQMVEQYVAKPGPSQSDKDANSVSMTVQTLNGGTFVAERPEYFNTAGPHATFVVEGGSDILGYDGN